MNLRALTRGDAAVAGAAVLLLISSFLPYRSVSLCILKSCTTVSSSAWTSGLLPILPSVFLLGLAAAALTLLQHFQGESASTRQVLGLRLDQWGIALAVAALWTSVWSLGAGNLGIGAYLAFLALLVLAGAAAGGPLVPALKAPLLSDKPAAPQVQGYPGAQGGYPGAGQQGQPGQQQPGQYDYGYQQGAPMGQGQPQAYGGQPQQPQPGGYEPQAGGYGYPAPGQPHEQLHQSPLPTPAPAPAPTPAPAPAPTPAPAPAADFAPFWFAVPVPRQLTPKDNPAGPPVGELVPGTWYLAVEQRGAALVAQLQDGTHGLLSDTSGIQRG
ncbi:hypothetical protein GCM10009760_32930 [Kitasatospora kazusensis]|uniref:Integral membrane protein n=1 Tax=Kitasatospora kazusensis TaxID=407974 RepID=A0ABN2ZN68_9ACTN